MLSLTLVKVQKCHSINFDMSNSGQDIEAIFRNIFKTVKERPLVKYIYNFIKCLFKQSMLCFVKFRKQETLFSTFLVPETS